MHYVVMIIYVALSSLFGILTGRHVIRYINDSKSQNKNNFSYKTYFLVIALLWVIAIVIGLINETYNSSGTMKICALFAMVISAVLAMKMSARK